MASKLSSLPNVFRKLVVTKLSTNFQEATEIVSTQLPKLKSDEILIKNRFVGINATDINISAGRYPWLPKPPFTPGLESLGEIVEIGSEVTNFRIGQPVVHLGLYGTFSEYQSVSAKEVSPIPKVNPEYLSLNLSGKTAIISLDKAGRIKKGNVVLITSAAGGTGQYAVQYAKYCKCHVVATCSNDKKVEFLQSLGCDRIINYKKEKLADVLKKEYPNGIDVVWETIGGDVLETCLKSLSVQGRLVTLGFISTYKTEDGLNLKVPLNQLKLVFKSLTISGFGLNQYESDYEYYHAKLLGLHLRKSIKTKIDFGDDTVGGRFKGLESIGRAVEYLHSTNSIGKVLVEI